MSLYVSRKDLEYFARQNGMSEECEEFLIHGTGPWYRDEDLGIASFITPHPWVDNAFCEAVIKHFWGRPIPEVQLRTAQSLARAHFHAWGFVDLDALPERTQVEIWLACQKQKRNMSGIDAPEMDEAGTITHTTGSGRLTWNVDPDGSTYLSIYRPDVEYSVLDVVFRVKGDVYEENEMAIWYSVNAPYHWRHVHALEQAARVVHTHLQVVSDAVFEKNMAELAAHAKPDIDLVALEDIFYLLRQGYGAAAVSLMQARLDRYGDCYGFDGRSLFKVTDNLIQYGYGRFEQEWSY